MESINGHRIEYDGVGAWSGQWHIYPAQIDPNIPLPFPSPPPGEILSSSEITTWKSLKFSWVKHQLQYKVSQFIAIKMTRLPRTGGWPAPLYNLYFESFLLICTSFVVRTRGIVCVVYLLFCSANYKTPVNGARPLREMLWNRQDLKRLIIRILWYEMQLINRKFYSLQKFTSRM